MTAGLVGGEGFAADASVMKVYSSQPSRQHAARVIKSGNGLFRANSAFFDSIDPSRHFATVH